MFTTSKHSNLFPPTRISLRSRDSIKPSYLPAASRALHLATPRGRGRRRRLPHRRRRSSENARQSPAAPRYRRTPGPAGEPRNRRGRRDPSYKLAGGPHPRAPHREVHQGHAVADVERRAAAGAVPRVPAPAEGGEGRGRRRAQGDAAEGSLGRHLRGGSERRRQQRQGEFAVWRSFERRLILLNGWCA